MKSLEFRKMLFVLSAGCLLVGLATPGTTHARQTREETTPLPQNTSLEIPSAWIENTPPTETPNSNASDVTPIITMVPILPTENTPVAETATVGPLPLPSATDTIVTEAPFIPSETPLSEATALPTLTPTHTPSVPVIATPTLSATPMSASASTLYLQGGSIPAFPGAEGFGAATTGGRGGRVIYVTTLAPDPDGITPGSLNWALHQDGARYILFKVSGVIHATANITHGNVTLAGQTSPGGVIVRGLVCDGHYDRNNCDNIIVRHIRSRLALDTVPAPPGVEIDEDTLRMDGAQNFVIDHSSFARSADEVAQVSWASYGTLQNNIFAETTGAHYEYGGMLLNYSHTDHPQDYLSIHHNMWHRIAGRLPEITCATSGYPGEANEYVDCQSHPLRLELSNNLYWDPAFLIWYNRFVDIEQSLGHGSYLLSLNMVNNYMVGRPTFDYPLMAHDFLDESGNTVYFSGNRINRYPGFADYQLAGCCRPFTPPNTNLGTATRRSTRHDFPPITYTSTNQLINYMINNVGAFPRDTMDRRYLRALQTNTIDPTALNLPAAQDTFTLDFDPNHPPAPPQDSDSDGMPNEFETRYGLNPNVQDHNGSQLSVLFTGISGYTNLECYLNWLSDNLVSGRPLPPSPLPAVPTPLTPNSTIATGNPTFTWTRPAGVTQYALYVYTNATPSVLKFANYVTPTCNASTCSYTPTLNLPAGSYKWAVKAGNTYGWSAYSIWKTFTVSAPAAPTPMTPSGAITTGNPTFTWTRPAGVTQYALYVYTNTTPSVLKFANYVTPTCNASTCSYTPTLNLTAGSYKWRVRAGNTNGWSPYSAWLNFVRGPDTIPAIVQPKDFHYLGAFRLPGDDTPPGTFAYGGSAMTFNPNGDASGSNDGFTGSLFITGIDRMAYGELPNASQVAEISIPAPVNSRSLDSLDYARILQGFRNVTAGFFTGFDEIPRIGMQYLNTPASGPKIHLAWGTHLQSDSPTATHAWFNPNLSAPNMQGTWFIGNQNPYSVNGYMLEIPAAWADKYANGRYLGTGRYKDGGLSGMGPALFAYRPWVNETGTPAPSGTHFSETVLLLYENAANTENIERCLNGYQHADEWEGGAWITTSTGKSAVLFAGTKSTGAKYWYGYINPTGIQNPCVDASHVGEFPVCRLANGTPCPSGDLIECAGHTSERGWWSTRFDAQFILYNPADLARVAARQMQPWQPQPYASLDIDEHLFLNPAGIEQDSLGAGDQRRYRIGDITFDRNNGLVYVLERFADEAKPVVHVWRVQ